MNTYIYIYIYIYTYICIYMYMFMVRYIYMYICNMLIYDFIIDHDDGYTYYHHDAILLYDMLFRWKR